MDHGTLAQGPSSDETGRLAALDRYQILDTSPEAAYDDIVSIAAQICGAPMALVSLVDDHRQWFKAAVGLSVSETPREVAFCAHAIQQDNIFVVRNALHDARFEHNPLVTGDPNLRFYAGAPLVTPDGYAIGTLCVLDDKPRELTNSQLEALRALSRQVVAQLELRKKIQQHAAAIDEKNLLMQEVHHRVKNSLAMVQSLLMLQTRATPHEEVKRELRECAGRIRSFEAMHAHLYQAGTSSEIDLAVYLRGLVDDQKAAFISDLNGRTIDFQGASIGWPAGDAPVLGLILVELCTNALKYGSGAVKVTLRHVGDEAQLAVEDEGNSLPAEFKPSNSKGLGMRVVTGLLSGQEDGRLEIDRSQGHTRFVASFRVPGIHTAS